MYQDIVKNYKPSNEQEEKDHLLMLDMIKSHPNILSRDNLAAHFTSSALIVNQSFTKIVFAYHLIYQEWAWIGGHNDHNPNFLEVAIKEAREETGLKTLIPHTKEPVMIDVIGVKNHIKKHQYVPDHLHLNVTYLLIANEEEALSIRVDEHSAIKWLNIEDMVGCTNDERMKPIYQKAFDVISRQKKCQKY